MKPFLPNHLKIEVGPERCVQILEQDRSWSEADWNYAIESRPTWISPPPRGWAGDSNFQQRVYRYTQTHSLMCSNSRIVNGILVGITESPGMAYFLQSTYKRM